jgi:uncharacterized protein Yka (UPF0111/DUF47 family)
MVLYGIQEPSDEVRRLTDLILVATELLAKTVHGLPGLEHVEEACVEINRLENAADDLFRGAVAALFDSDRSPTDVLKWKEIYELLEAVTDRCEDVANVIETIALRHA